MVIFVMKRRPLLFFAGLIAVCVSLSVTVTIFASWVKVGLSNGVTVSVQSVAFGGIWIGVICVVVGTVGGYLMGRYLEEFKRFLKSD